MIVRMPLEIGQQIETGLCRSAGSNFKESIVGPIPELISPSRREHGGTRGRGGPGQATVYQSI